MLESNAPQRLRQTSPAFELDRVRSTMMGLGVNWSWVGSARIPFPPSLRVWHCRGGMAWIYLRGGLFSSDQDTGIDVDVEDASIVTPTIWLRQCISGLSDLSHS
jgi:hypothetical protein